MDKLVITAAVTGAFLTKEQHPALPVTPEEITAEMKRCHDAGATIAHLHARHPDPAISDYDVLGTTIRMINEVCPIITQVGTGVRSRFGEIRTEEERLHNFLNSISPRPDMITVNGGTFHFRILSKKEPMGSKGRSYLYSNSPQLIADFTRGGVERGYGLEFECFDAGQIENIKALRETGVLSAGHQLNFNLVMGIGGGIPATPKALDYMIEAVPAGSHWTVTAIGRHQAPLTTLGIVLGGGVRVGFEDNVYLYKGELATSNAQFVERVVKIAREVGREVATVEETRALLAMSSKTVAMPERGRVGARAAS
jgi:3-keto-5-aminohexanoate cleavage enzyme